MEYRTLGRTGLPISILGFGCGSVGGLMVRGDRAEQVRAAARAIELDINFFDTANAYSNGRSEEITGELLKDYRDDVVIATKVYFAMGDGPNERGLSRVHILHQIEQSLKRLQTDYVDLYQTHRWDSSTPIEETLRTFNDLVHQGKVRYIGASSMWAWQFAKALWASERLGVVRFESMQNFYNLCYREEEREMIPLCQDQQIGVLPWLETAHPILHGDDSRCVDGDGP